MLHLRGRDIAGFLQGQLTCDTRDLETGKSIPGALCSAKGRVLSDVLLLKRDEDHCVLRLRRSVAAAVTEVLSRYAQFSRISVEEETSQDRLYGVYGELPENLALRASTAGEVQLQPIPEAIDQVASALDGRASIVRRSARSVEVFFHDDTQPFPHLEEDVERRGTQAAWQGELLRAGHFAIDGSALEKYTPQALNYDLTGLVSFKKGCYTGQEVVARLHYKGKSKKRLGVYTSEHAGADVMQSPPRVDVGDSLHQLGADARTSPRTGKVLRVGEAYDGGLVVAAEVQADFLDLPLITSADVKLTPIRAETSRLEDARG